MKRFLPFVTILLIVFFFLLGCDLKSKDTFQVLSGRAMGTTYSVNYDISQIPLEDSQKINQRIKEIINDVNQKMSTYIRQSELSRFNQFQEVKQPFYISDDMAKVIKEAIRLHKLTNGALDITMGPLVNLWGFGPEKNKNMIPTPEQIALTKQSVGMHLFALHKDQNNHHYLLKFKPEVYLDLSSIAKGFAVDQVASYLDSLHIKNYLIEIGGEIKSKGFKSPHEPWQIAIEKPNWKGLREIEQIVNLKSNSIATSGVYRNYYQIDGKFYNHEINPQSGYPSQSDILSVSVVDPSNMTADGLATGFTVMNSEQAIKLAEDKNIPIFIIAKNPEGQIKKIYSKSFIEFMRKK